MTQPPTSPTFPAPRPPSPRRRRWVLVAALLGLAVAAWFGGRNLWAWHHWRKAGEAAQRSDFPAALASFERCLRVWPHSAVTHLQAARAARRGGLIEQAEAHLTECEKNGGAPELSLERVLLLGQQGDLSGVESSLQERVQAGDPDSTLLLEALAQGYFRQRHYGRALDALDRLLQREPLHPGAHYWRGQIFEELERMGEAVPAYRRAVELAPHSSTYRLRLVQALVDTGEVREAWPHVAELARQLPASPEVRLAQARCLRAFTQQDAALEQLDALLADEPDNAEAWAERGLTCRDRGDHAEAVRSLRRAAALAPASYRIGCSLHAVLQDQGHAEEASLLWQRLEGIRHDQDRVRAINARLAVVGPNADLLCEAATLLLRLRNEPEARRCLRLALRYEPGHRPSHAALAAYYESKGDTASAAAHRAQAGGGPP